MAYHLIDKSDKLCSYLTKCKEPLDETKLNHGKSVSCTVCGPIEMAMQTQKAIRQSQRAILRGRLESIAEIYLHKSSFSW